MPAFVEGRAFDVLASNRLAVALSPRLQPGYNRLRSLLLDPEERAFQQDWARSTEGFVAAFRKSAGDDVDNPRFVELVGELALSSERFRALWARHDVRNLGGGTTTVTIPWSVSCACTGKSCRSTRCSWSSTTPSRAARATRNCASSPA